MAKKSKKGLTLKTNQPYRSQKSEGDNYLLIIGIDQYVHSRPLNNAVSDARAFMNLLQNKYAFLEKNTVTRFDKKATRSQIWDSFNELKKNLNEEDNLIIYYSGHGYLNQELDWGYWVPVDGKPGKEDTFLRNREIIDFIKVFPCHHLLLISDSCFSGSFFSSNKDVVNTFSLSPSRWALTSGRKQKVLDGPVGKSSPFAEYLIKYLSENNGELLISELGNKVKIATNAYTEMYQTPRAEPLQIKGHEGGEFIFKVRTSYQTNQKQIIPSSKRINESQKMDFLFPEMVFVKGGTFQMGTNDIDRSKPQHTVEINSFYIGQYEITNSQYVDFLNKQKHPKVDKWLNLKAKTKNKCCIQRSSKKFSVMEGYEDYPVIFVSWYGAEAYCKWLSEITTKKTRLPTEAEWEFAALGGIRSRGFYYAGGNSPSNLGWFDENSLGVVHPIGQKKANELNIYDMVGNVNEWCLDRYGVKYYQTCAKQQTVINPKGLIRSKYRVIRGGSWFNNSLSLSVRHRDKLLPESQLGTLGFRIVQED